MKTFGYFGLALISLLEVGCASSKYHVANYEYSNMMYYKASKKYAAYLKHHNKPLAIMRISDCYHKMHDYQQAEYWYSRAVTLKECAPADKLAYASILKINGKYDLAKKWFAEYLHTKPTDMVAKAQMISCDSIDVYNAKVAAYQVEPLQLSGNVNSFGMTRFESGFVYCAEQYVSQEGKNNNWDGRPYMNMLFTTSLPSGRFAQPESFSETLNSPYHNGPIAFTSSFDRIFFSRSNYTGDKLGKNADKVNNIKLYTARRNGKEWTDIEELPFNNNNFSCGQPSLTASGDTLFFVSDRPGGKGSTDIYMSVKSSGKWSAPINLGTSINTAGSEMFPTYCRDNSGHCYLYFSSDGWPGMGGLDLYRTELLADGTWATPRHLNAPFNSPKDDFGIIFNDNNTSGYLSSSRDGDKDRLYSFAKVTDLFAKGAVYNKKTNELLIATLVEIDNQTTGKRDLIMTDSTGRFYTQLARNANYTFNASKDNFIPGQATASTFDEKGEVIDVRIDLDAGMDIPAPEHEYLAQLPVAFANVYFDFNKWDLRSDADEPLSVVIERMMSHPEMKLEIGAHADARGTDEYNMGLSKKRVTAVINYLSLNGISKDRMKARWFGKSHLVNDCGDGVDCPPEMHQLNRRVEFRLLNQNKSGVESYYTDNH
jgi:peptidoglycan-associated lipoprotein